jgi:arylsulfatase A-like enzyme
MSSSSSTYGRREFLQGLGRSASAGILASGVSALEKSEALRRPNVVLIMTDDQGYGDLGCHGNQRLRTPNLDRFAAESVELTHYHSSPVCTPTRASLMTGRYNYRTRAIDTYLGRAMMEPGEVTIAEMLSAAGYRTAIFGKWHLGDNYPMRPMEHGFQEVLVHRGGGIGQPSDLPGGSHYADPVLLHNGRIEAFRGYCMDVYTDAAMRFITSNSKRSFFVYLATNTPHTPLEIADSYTSPYRAMGLDEGTARIYGMIANIDENVGRLLARLKTLDLEQDTIVIFATDNGAQQINRYSAGLRAGKGTVYDGGIRVPFFIRWPARLKGGRQVEQIAAHIDVVPTLLDACGAAKPANLRLDGASLLPLLKNGGIHWPERTLYFQWHRGDTPELYRDCAARCDRWKLVMHLDKNREPAAELYDMVADPGETRDAAAEHREIVNQLRQGYEAWFQDVSATRGYDPPRIHLGTRFENPTTLTRQDWRGPQAGWEPESLGCWAVLVAASGNYEITLRFAPTAASGGARFRLGDASALIPYQSGTTELRLSRIPLKSGPGRLEAWLESGGRAVGVHYVDVKRLP